MGVCWALRSLRQYRVYLLGLPAMAEVQAPTTKVRSIMHVPGRFHRTAEAGRVGLGKGGEP